MNHLNILVVDDARSERILLRHTLTDIRRDLVVHEATDHASALKALNAHSIDMAFLDIQMPGLSGIELLRDMLDIRPDLDVIMVSHHSTQEYVVKALRYGAVGYLIKPFNIARIAEMIENHERKRDLVDG